MSDILFDVTAYTSRPSSFTDYELDTQGWDDQPPPVARPATGQNTGNSLGFKEGSRIHLTLHPSKTGTISHYHKPTGGWWVNWDNGNNYAVPGESLELDPNSLGFKESDRPTSVPKYRFYIDWTLDKQRRKTGEINLHTNPAQLMIIRLLVLDNDNQAKGGGGGERRSPPPPDDDYHS